MTMETPVPSVRRNGKRPSCEPCRLSKQSCDHVMPICGRCKKKNIPQRCVWHPNPMTGLKPRVRKQPDTPEHRPRPRPRSQPQTPSSVPSPRVQPSHSWTLGEDPQTTISRDPQSTEAVSKSNWRHSFVLETSISNSVATPRTAQTPVEWSTLGRSSQNPYNGFLGSTSFSAVFDESNNIVSADDQNDLAEPPTEGLSSREHKRKIKEGAAVLAHLNEYKHLVPLLARWLEYAKGLALMGPVTMPCVDSIGRDIVSKGLDHDQLLAVSDKLLQNSTKPIKVPPTLRLSEYHTLFTGENMRWESLAVLFTAAGLSAILLRPTDPQLEFVGQQPSEKQAFIHRMVELGSSCLSFCTDLGHLNDLGIWVLHEHCLLVSQILGDAHYLTWRRSGDLATAVFAMGLHQEIKDRPDVPFWLAEFRRRSMGVMYSIDKMLAVFLGRPPRISHRYCSVVNPIDLELEELDEDGPELAKKLAMIDETTGWNTDGQMRKSSHTRCFVMMHRIREDILELSLGHSIVDVSAASADIAQRNEQAWNEYPKHIKYYPEIWTSKRPADECVIAVIIYLDVVYNEFLLQRTLVRRIKAPSEALIRISRLLLTTVLSVVNNRSQCGTAGCDAAWMVVLYGLPASGVLALELLQQTQNRAAMTKDFPRSEVIQNLSVFVSCLGWIHDEGDGNYHLCIQARNMIQRILDRVLSPDAAAGALFPSSSAGQGQTNLLTPSSQTDYNTAGDDAGMYDFSWMDNAQFDADFWSNLDFHPLLAGPDGTA